ncbi:MAG: zf-HC2 domain-containing protein [Paenibacillaceae bacterium]
MNCEQIMDEMQRYVDEDLTQAEQDSLMAHIKQCPDCAASFEQLQRLSAQLRLLPKVSPPFSIVDSILPKLAELDAEQAVIRAAYLPTGPHTKKPLFSWKIGAGFIAAAVIFSLVLVNLEPSSQNDASEMMNKSLDTNITSSVGSTNFSLGIEGDVAKPEAKSLAPTATAAIQEAPRAAATDKKSTEDKSTDADKFTLKSTEKADTLQKEKPAEAQQENSAAASRSESLNAGSKEQKSTAAMDITTNKLKVTFGQGKNANGQDENMKESQVLVPQPAPTPAPMPATTPTPAPTPNQIIIDSSLINKSLKRSFAVTPELTQQSLTSDDGNFIGVIERQIVQVQTPDGNRSFTSSVQWKPTDQIHLLQWQDNQRLTYEVIMEDGQLKRYIIDVILKTEQEQ